VRRLVLVHGFTQTRRCWAPVDTDLATDHEVVAVDAPGHGDRATVVAGIDDGAALLGEAAGRAVYVGYSMGGRYCLRLALDRPDLVAGLVLIGASPGLADAGARADRRRADEALADHVEAVGVAAFLDEWLAQPLFAGLPAERRCLTERRTNTAAGLASSLRRAGTGAQTPLWDRLGELTAPTLLVTGAGDAKFTAIAGQMAAGVGPAATHVVLPGTGHTAHLEDPAGFTAALRSWEADQATADTSSPTDSSTPKTSCTRPV
jgi:2-succinyl-6-hydroxy-2,4-cyclohexadiene-1-carboxylate synthase